VSHRGRQCLGTVSDRHRGFQPLLAQHGNGVRGDVGDRPASGGSGRS
jgi:hypothetical protein